MREHTEAAMDASNPAIRQARIEVLPLRDADPFPNNPLIPVLVYHGAFALDDDDERATCIEQTFHSNGWTNGWRDTVYDYHHYHSVAHEVLGCFRGRAILQVGGDHGPKVELAPGDVVMLPAGTAHKKLSASEDFLVVGAYAEGREYDMLCGQERERPHADERIRTLPPPRLDPVYGADGPLTNE